jgi:cell division septal protein FtsQ
MATNPEAGERRQRSWLWPVVLLLPVLGFLVWGLSPYILGMFSGDRPLPRVPIETLRIENRTERTLLVSYVFPNGTEVMLTEIAPHAVADAPIACKGGEIVARTRSGTAVAQSDRFTGCLEKWVIPSPRGG